MRNPLRSVVVSTLIFTSLGIGTANANVTINVTEVGGNVVFKTSGSLDLTAASFLGTIGYTEGFIPGGSNWYIGSGPGTSILDRYEMTSFAGAFGTSERLVFPDLVFGDDFMIWGNHGNTEEIGVSVGYISGSDISSRMVFVDASIKGLTMIPGTYIYKIPSDTVTLNIAPVPEPETYAMLLAGLGLIGFMARRRNQSS